MKHGLANQLAPMFLEDMGTVDQTTLPVFREEALRQGVGDVASAAAARRRLHGLRAPWQLLRG